jgi:hypothetical protein
MELPLQLMLELYYHDSGQTDTHHSTQANANTDQQYSTATKYNVMPLTKRFRS